MNVEEIKGIINEIGDVADLFYMQKNNEAYNKLDNLIVQISTVLDTIFRVEKISMNLDKIRINQVLIEAMNAMEVKDSILLADILKYDLTEQFNQILIMM